MNKIIAILLMVILYTPTVASLSPKVDMFTEVGMIDSDKSEDKAEKKEKKEFTSSTSVNEIICSIALRRFSDNNHLIVPSPIITLQTPPPDQSC